MKHNLIILLLLFIPGIFCHGTEGKSPDQLEASLDNSRLISQFNELAESGRLPAILADSGTANLEFPTFGGHVFWETHEAKGWKLQFNSISGWWRILDNNNMRVARGTSPEQLKSLLNNRPTSILTNYLDKGFRFAKTPAVGKSTGQTVVLIHGWGVRARSMQELADSLAQHGYDAYSYDYPSSKCTLSEHCRLFLEQFRELLHALSPEEKIHVLTHSMGGLILRGAMAEMSSGECQRLSAIVMLGPPNRGSHLAYFGKMPLVSEINASLQDMTPSDDSFVSTIPAPPWLPPVGIIAGKYDGKVAMEDTWLPEPLPCSHTVVNCTHPGLRKPSHVLSLILQYFETLTFE